MKWSSLLHFALTLGTTLINGQATPVSTDALTTVSGTATRSSSTSVRSTVTTAAPDPLKSAPACCWIAAQSGNSGKVQGNWWYQTTATQTVATVFSTIIDYGNSTEVANVSTKYISPDAIWTLFGEYRLRTMIFGTTVLDINTGLANFGVPSTLLSQSGDYAATRVYRPNETTLYGIAYPTPFLLYHDLEVFYDYNSPCASYETVVNLGSTFTTSALATPIPTEFNIKILSEIFINSTRTDVYTTDAWAEQSQYFYATPLPTDGPNPGFSFFAPASGAIEKFITIENSAYPWLSKCWPYSVSGEPTVHVAVDQLTETSQVTIKMSRPTVTAAPQSTDANTAENDNEVSPSNPMPAQTPNPNQPATSQPTQTMTTAQSPDSGANTPASPSQQRTDDNGQGAIPTQAASTSDVTIVNIESGPTTLQPGDPGIVIGQSVTEENSSAVTPSTMSNNPDQEASGDTTPPAPLNTAIPPTSTAAIITYGTRTISITPGSSGAIILDESITLPSGGVTVLDGSTVSYTDGNVIVGSGSSEATANIGDAVMSGLGGTGTGSSGGTYTGPAYMGSATKMCSGFDVRMLVMVLGAVMLV